MSAQGSDDALVALAGRLREVIVPLVREIRRCGGALTPTQLSVLGSIHRLEPIALGELAAAERLSAPMISRVVASLENEGLVARAAKPDDRRVSRVRITAAGREWISNTQAQRNAWLAAGLAELETTDLDAVARAVPALELLLNRRTDAAAAAVHEPRHSARTVRCQPRASTHLSSATAP